MGDDKTSPCELFLLACILLGLTVGPALTRNSQCTESALAGLKPAYEGELLPADFVMIQRHSKRMRRVDVYEATNGTSKEEKGKYLGAFYDMNFVFFTRFGFSDAQDRIWFEARPVSIWSLFKPGEYTLRRCDGRGGTFNVVGQWRLCSWSWVGSGCQQTYKLTSRDGSDVEVRFGSRFDGLRDVWMMRASTGEGYGRELAMAQQHFTQGLFNLRGALGAISHWKVHITPPNGTAPSPQPPNWAFGFMAVLDDLREDKS